MLFAFSGKTNGLILQIGPAKYELLISENLYYQLNLPRHFQGDLNLDVIVTDMVNKKYKKVKTLEFTVESDE